MRSQGTQAEAEFLEFAAAQGNQLFRVAYLMCGDWHEAQDSIERLAVMYADVAGFYGYTVYEQRPDGIRVSIQVANGTLGGVPHPVRAGWPWVSRAVPPGSMRLWRSVVESSKLHL